MVVKMSELFVKLQLHGLILLKEENAYNFFLMLFFTKDLYLKMSNMTNILSPIG